MISKIGKYEILRRVGTGGFGSVYEALDPLIRRTVAIKTCEAKDPKVRARFFQEAQLGGSLRHRNITTVYDFSVDEAGTPYIVQEFLDGDDLDRIIGSREGLPLIDKLRILIGIAYGLEYAHNAGIIHRDVKPGNIRILSDGTVKLMDFGIAKAAGMGPGGTGRKMGTFAYLAPERILERPVDARGDVFSFGVVAYELLAGRRPFDGATEEELFERIVSEEPVPLAEIAPDVSPAVASIVARALQKAPEDRYPSVELMRNAILSAFHGLFGRDAPLTAGAESPGASTSDRTDGPSPDYVETRELGGAVSHRELTHASAAAPPRAAGPPAAVTPPAALPVPWPIPDRPADVAAPASQRRQRRLSPAVAASVAVACVLGAILLRGASTLFHHTPVPTAGGEVPTGKITSVPPRAAISPVPVAAGSGPPLSYPVTLRTAAPGPSPVNEPPHPAARAAETRLHRTSTPAARSERRGSPVITRVASSVKSRYARAAEEPGLSSDTRAAIYLSGAWERYRAGDLTGAREMLTSAYSLRKDLDLDPSRYDAAFRRLAESVRSVRNRPS